MCKCFSYFVICCSSQVLMHSSWWSFVLNPIMGTWSIPASTGFEYMAFFFPNDLTHSHFILTPCIEILNSTCMGDLLQPHGNSVLRMIWSSLWLDKILETKIFNLFNFWNCFWLIWLCTYFTVHTLKWHYHFCGLCF